MRLILHTFLFAGLVGAVMFIPTSTAAQSPLSFEVTPTAPGPNEEVTVSVSAAPFNTSRASIVWHLGGERMASGGRTFTFETGGVGEESTVTARATQPNGVAHSDSVTIEPSTVEFVWEADTYTPPFYDGKARFTPMADAHVLAIPHTDSSYTPSELLYEWRSNGRTVSGRQANNRTYTLEGSFTEQTPSVSVRVYTPSGTLLAHESIGLAPVDPQVRLYPQDDTGTTDYNNAITDRAQLSAQRMTLTAVPYFFSVTNPTDRDLQYTWRMNNEQIAAPRPSYTLPVGTDGNGQGTSRISVSASHNSHIAQQAQLSTLIEFGIQQEVDADF